MYVPPLHQVFERVGFSTNMLLSEPVWCYRATGQFLLSSPRSSLYTGCGRASGRKLRREDRASPVRPHPPPPPFIHLSIYVNAYLVLRPPRGDLLACDHTSFHLVNFKETRTTKEKIVALNGKSCCQTSWWSFFFFFFGKYIYNPLFV